MAVTSVNGDQIVDLRNDTNYYFEVAPQGDSQFRFVDVTLTDNGMPYNLPVGCNIILEGKNAGGYNVFVTCTQVDNNVIRIPLSNGVLSYSGVGTYIVGIYDNNSYILSFPFNIVVVEAPYNMESLQSSDVYEALNKAIAKAMSSNKWIVGNGDPTTLSIVGDIGDYYLDSSNGSLWRCIKEDLTSALEWTEALDSSGNQINIMEKTYIRYSMSPDGNPMYPTPYDTSTTPPTVRNYIGFFVTVDLPTDSEVADPDNYTWSPLRIGVTNVTTEYAKSNSYITHPTTGWQNTIPLITGDSDDYLWTKIILHLEDGQTFEYYTVTQYGKYGDFGANQISSIEEAIGQPEVNVTVDTTSPSTAKIFDFQFKVRGGHWKYGTIIASSGTQTVTALNSSNTVIGDMYFNEETGVTYRCTAVTDTNSTWEEVRELRGGIWRFGTQISGSGIQTSTYFTSNNTIVGDTFVNNSTGIVYECTAVTSSGSTWQERYTLGPITQIDELSNTMRFYATLHPGDLSLNITGTGSATMFNPTDAERGSGYYYHIKFLATKPNVNPNLDYEAVITSGQISVDLTFRRNVTKNMIVKNIPSGANPQAKGWYEVDDTSTTGYSLTSDTSVVSGKTYYEDTDICLEVIKKTL